MAAKLLTPVEELTLRIERIVTTFGRADSTLLGREVTSHVVNNFLEPVAYSGDDQIWFNVAHMRSDDFFTPEGLIGLTGLNYHELSHLIWSPPTDSRFRRWMLMFRQYHPIWNVLEDQRIERLLCGKYLAVRPYLTAVFMRFILDQKAKLPELYPLVVGRRHVPKKVRNLLRAEYKYPHILPQLESIINEYLTIVHPRDDAKAERLVRELYTLMESVTPPPEFLGHDHRPTKQQQSPPSEEAQIEAGQSASKAEEEEQFEGEPGEGEPQDGEDGEEPSTGGTPDNKEEIEKAAKKTLDQVRSNQDVQRDVDQKLTASRAIVRPIIDSTLPRLEPWEHLVPTNDLVMAVQSCARELQLLSDEVAPGWTARHPTGRLNMRHVMRDDADPDTAFDRWEPGNADAFDIEVIIAIDLSGSMEKRNMWREVAKAAWVVRRSVEVAGGDLMVTTLGYDEKRQVTLSARGERCPAMEVPVFMYEDYTDPTVVLTEARRIFAASNRRFKVMFVMSDGLWLTSDRRKTYPPGTVVMDDNISMMNDAGVTTVYIHMFSTPPSYGKDGKPYYKSHGCQIHAPFFKALDLVAVFRTVVAKLMRGGKA